MMRKKLNGYMTVFSSLCFALIVSLITVCIDGARLQGARALAYMINDLSLDTLMSYYSKPLFEEYQLLFLDAGFGENKVDENKIKEIVMNNAVENMEKPDNILIPYTSYLSADIAEFDITNMVKAVDNSGKIMEKEITEYMKYAYPAELLTDFEKTADDLKNAEDKKDTNDEHKSLEKAIRNQNNKIFELIEKVDGIRTKKGSISVSGGTPDIVTTYAKKIMYYDKSMSQTGINNADIYNAISPLYIELNKTFKDITDKYNEILDKPEAERQYDMNDEYINNTISALINNTKEAREETEAALTILAQIREASDDVEKKKDEAKKKIDNKDADEDTKNTLKQTIDDMCEGGCIFDEDEMESGLRHNLSIYSQIIELENISSTNTTSENINSRIQAINNCEDYAKTLKIRELSFDYSKFDVNSSSNADDILDSIEDFLDNGILSLVIDDTSTLSEASLSVTPNAVIEGDTDVETVNPVYGKFLTTQYALDYFDNYLEDNSDNTIKYELEYILCGEKTDKGNLTETVLKLAAIREAANLAYLFSSPSKMQEAMTLATTLVGFTGIYPLIKVTQLAIIALWAYAEGIMDARVLLAGGKVDIMKTDDTWMMSLDNLMNKDIKNNTKQSDSGYTYKQYLQFMLYLKNEETVIVRMMDLIEEKMHKLGYTGFAMKNCIYSLDTTSSYDIRNGSRNIKVIAHKNY